LGSSELASSTVNSFIAINDEAGATAASLANEAHSKLFGKMLLLRNGGLFTFRLWHEITSTRTDFQTAIFAFLVARFNPHSKFMHSAVIFFAFRECETKTVARREVAHNSRQTCSVVFRSINAQGFAPGLLGEIFRAAIQTDAQPAGERFSDRHQEFEQRA